MYTMFRAEQCVGQTVKLTGPARQFERKRRGAAMLMLSFNAITLMTSSERSITLRQTFLNPLCRKGSVMTSLTLARMQLLKIMFVYYRI